MWELDCIHDLADAPNFYLDENGKPAPNCLVQEWLDATSIGDIIDTSNNFDNSGRILLWTTWGYDHEPTLVGRDQYLIWKENREYEGED